jgi:hypothetical protein
MMHTPGRNWGRKKIGLQIIDSFWLYGINEEGSLKKPNILAPRPGLEPGTCRLKEIAPL